ncbi:MAG: hypothetical protein AAGJ35_02360, partial [Myxococcota bacterium]
RMLRRLRSEILERARQHRRAFPKDTVQIIGNQSILDFIPTQQAEKLIQMVKTRAYLDAQNIEEWEEDPKKRKQFVDFQRRLIKRGFSMQDLPFSLRWAFVLRDRNDPEKIAGYVLLIKHTMNSSKGQEAVRLARLLPTFQWKGHSIAPAGEAMILAKMTSYLERDSVWVCLGSFLGVLLVVFGQMAGQVGWRSGFRYTGYALFPLLSGMLLLFGAQVVWDIPVNLFNMVVYPSLLGMGIDAGVHLLHRLREVPENGVLAVQREMRWPIILASLTTVVSFASLIVSAHVGLRTMGWVAVIGLGMLLVACLVWLPAWLERSEH